MPELTGSQFVLLVILGMLCLFLCVSAVAEAWNERGKAKALAEAERHRTRRVAIEHDRLSQRPTEDPEP